MEDQQGKSRLTRKLSSKLSAPQAAQKPTSERPTQPAPVRSVPTFKQPGIVKARSLLVRRDHSMNAETVSTLRNGERVNVLETWTDGRDTWARIGNGQWVAMTYNGQTYIELI
ncbi:MAG: hypothetical protein AB1649_16670 [Chloroflexota bacterium]